MHSNISISSRQAYYWHKWVFIIIVLIQLLISVTSIFLMSSVRAVVGGESLWSKGLNSAILHLNHYARSGADADYKKFNEAITVPLSLSIARKELDRGGNNKQLIRESLIKGGNHPFDVHVLSHVMPLVWNLEHFSHSRNLWHIADYYINLINSLGVNINNWYLDGNNINNSLVNDWKDEISYIHEIIFLLEKDFIEELGNSSRKLGFTLTLLNIFTAILLSSLYWITLKRTINERRSAYLTLDRERLQSKEILESLEDGVITLDSSNKIVFSNPSAIKIIGEEKIKGRSIFEIIPFTIDVINKLKINNNYNTKPHDCQNIYWIEHSDKDKVAVRISATIFKNNYEIKSGMMLVLHDVSKEQSYMRMLDWQQNHDLLTGLDNRNAFERHLVKYIGKCESSLLHLNLDHFKMINASFGHYAGDEMLRQICQQLRLALREKDIIARIGGDEFAVLLTHCHPHAAMQTAERLRKSIQDLNVQWHQHNLHSGVSIGVVHMDACHESDPQALLGMANSACKHAKESGRNRISVYDPLNKVFQRHQGDMEWVLRLRDSLENNNFTLFAQTVHPFKIDESHNSNIHFEVLLRLQDETNKSTYPGDFIPIAERYDLMPEIDRWVIKKTLQILRDSFSKASTINTCAINLSGASLGDADLLQFIKHHIEKNNIPASKLCFEITETSAISNMESAVSLIKELRKLGCRFSLDDFGAGMASFKYLQQLPVDYLKIDGGFVRDMLENKHNYAMVDAINHIGHVMGKYTVAEFVGDAKTFQALKAMGVDYAQGYYISAPIPFNSEYLSHVRTQTARLNRSEEATD